MSGKSPAVQVIEDILDPARAAALHAALGLPGDPPREGAPLPPMWHRIHFWQAAPPAALGPDGHPRPGQGLVPAVIATRGLTRRRWAGGQVDWHAPLVIGQRASCRSHCENLCFKEGRRGAFALLRLVHEISQNGRLCIREAQDLAYLPPARNDSAPPEPAGPRARGEAVLHVPCQADSTLLFRYSALTFNGHRIHYDADYAREAEGYAGLVVHGPLLAHWLASLALRELGSLHSFAYRAIAPLVAGEEARACAAPRPGGGLSLWVEGPGHRLCMEAEAT